MVEVRAKGTNNSRHEPQHVEIGGHYRPNQDSRAQLVCGSSTEKATPNKGRDPVSDTLEYWEPVQKVPHYSQIYVYDQS